MDYGLCLPNFTARASREMIDAAVETAVDLGWSTVWTTDHVLVGTGDAEADYARNFDAIATLAYVAGRDRSLRLGTSVIVVPQRNAVVVAKELATIDALSGGRLIAGVGVGWDHHEFANLGMADRFPVRGAYLDETIALWRHLWSGSHEPFEGRFHALDDFVFDPLPDQRERLPVLVGGRSAPALRRAGGMADGYHASQASPAAFAERVPLIHAAAAAAGRPTPALSARVNVRLDEDNGPGYALRRGAAGAAADIRAFADIGLAHLAFHPQGRDPEAFVRACRRLAEEVLPLV